MLNDTLSFSSAKPVSNNEKFGITIRGESKATILKFFGGGKVMFDIWQANDIQVDIRNLTLIDGDNMVNFAFRLGNISRYSIFENVRIMYFNYGFLFHDLCYRITFNDIYIRGCRFSIVVDPDIVLNEVLTELVFNRCYIDNNGAGENSAHMKLYNVQETRFNDCVFEGNFSLEMMIYGLSENILFHACRFEETAIITPAASGHIHYIGGSARNVTFKMCEIAYKQNGVSGDKNYSLFYIQNDVKFEDCQFIDTGNLNPTNVFGATPATAQVQVINCYSGIGADFKVTIPKRYQNIKIGNSFM